VTVTRLAASTRPLSGVAWAFGVVAFALVPRLLLRRVLEDRSTFILFTLAVMVCARFGGGLSGLVATFFSAIAGIVVFLNPAVDEADRAANLIEIFLFAFVGVGITWLAQQLRPAARQAEDALEQVRTLTGLLPICAWCKKIQNEAGQWQQLEQYISQRSSAEFTHGLCPQCARRVEAQRHRTS